MKRIVRAECLSYIQTLPDGSFPLIYLDPPFNTGKVQKRNRMRVVQDEGGSRLGFGSRSSPPSTSTPSTTSWPSSSPACARPIAC